MSMIVKAAAIQRAPVLDDAWGTIEIVLDSIKTAAAEGARLVVFPETFAPYYPYFSFVQPPVSLGARHMKLYEHAVVIGGPATDAVANAARQAGTFVLLGITERDHGSLYNTQLLFGDKGEILLRRRKLTPSFHERMVWGMGDASGLQVADTAIGKIGALACWEHFNPLARYALMAQHEEIHCSHFPGSMVGRVFADQIDAAMRHHAAESGCFVVNATGWLREDQIKSITSDPAMQKAISGGSHSCIISPEGQNLVPPLRDGEGMLLADLDMSLIVKRKRMMDSVGHYARPELLSLAVNAQPASPMHMADTGFSKGSNDGSQSDTQPADRAQPPDPGSAIARAAAE
ncbi:MAG: Nit6803 family nitriliase [Acidocella sp.]|nr:Nit6803 family nitriliase [Acidocella sp.]